MTTIRSITSNYTISANDLIDSRSRDTILQVDPTSEAIVLTLPPTQTATSGKGQARLVINVLNNTNHVWIADPDDRSSISVGSGADAFRGNASTLLTGTTLLEYDGNYWVGADFR